MLFIFVVSLNQKKEQTMNRQFLKSLAGGTIFSVKFIKKDGSLRTMTCRLGVKKHLNPSSRGLTDNQKQADVDNNCLRVTDMALANRLEKGITTDAKGKTIRSPYRTIPINRVLYIKARGAVAERDSLEENFSYK